ncbi:thiol:disulfide interchange protein DsbA/DsbL [Marinobacter qingdaonensis]|jgi:thiol:disulfide interchange protein DsbA|uniref:Thiol:disulfide interchange protein n=1 Tax=Marinobacter qingdaonensis TaxID=3108486 RepID=A0ABU5NXN6_9GAMM|nr:thiol:disulfide interchange protein DsbA/DsbL [Marinobacter sp. ASW11-75]MEA1080569.1 thiol:disulfide interchange protein DsbA/DsbL [Marinobacter sp. ASW11-75]MEE2762288.1 thiol:disulfide interchange protein DsbA/DsbL [Pseudomonadota bacterium]MEE3118663.1 thiol:disulfide interchange protein DsbA/DsbL [Pseudomonadota bacterium]
MIRTLGTAAFLAVAFAVGAPASADTWEEGTHYQKLDTPVRTDSNGKVEVAEVFWYGCPHCYNFKPVVEAWEEGLAEDVEFVMMPAALGRSWEPHARAYYALEAMGQLDKVHDALFEALAGERRPLNTPEALADFVAGYGVDADAFLKNYQSFGVNARMQQAQSKIRGARITGVPTMLVNGKYKVSASMAGSHEATLEVVDYLVAKERGTGAE